MGQSSEQVNSRADGRFVALVLMLSDYAMMAMGKIVDPVSGEQRKDLEQARVFIDFLEMLDEKSKGNLAPAEENLIKTQLTNLRLNFVDEANKGEVSTAEQGTAQAAAASTANVADEQATAASDEQSSAADGKRDDAPRAAKVVEVNDEGRATVVDKRASAQPDDQ